MDSFEDARRVLRKLETQMAQTQQNPYWHGEGDVLTHTRMVWKAMSELDGFREEDKQTREILCLAALLHDIGKIKTTRLEDGQWVSGGHARMGAQMARTILWQDLGLCGTPEKQNIRETVCSLIRFHSLPAYAINDPEGKRKLLMAASAGMLAPGFSIHLLCLLEEADALGRYCTDQADMLERVELCRELAREARCYDGPFPFVSDYSRFSYFSGKDISPEQGLYDDTWGEVILMAGLPGTGKDTWIRTHYSDLPMISLDDIRAELGILPTDHQSRVIETARERAKKYLRGKQPFVWNATNLSPMLRKKQIDLFTSYGASTRIVYLETSWEEQLRRNGSRNKAVPEQRICNMLDVLEPPQLPEAHRVQWHCI